MALVEQRGLRAVLLGAVVRQDRVEEGGEALRLASKRPGRHFAGESSAARAGLDCA